MLTRETAFMGRVTAGVTHELKNVFAIIKESAGLVEDILAMNKDAVSPQHERIARVLSNITQQVGRGVDLSTRLNAFAHSPDETSASVDLNVVVEQVVCLCQRFARLKTVVLVAKQQPQKILLVTDPLKIQMLFVHAIDLLLKLVPPGTTVCLEPTDRGNSEVAVAFSPNGGEAKATPPVPADLHASADWPGLGESAGELNGTLEPGPAPAWFTVVFR
jgi:light-regulated signal transduction histidine kinase (bacteriophytochrome)